MAAVARVCAGNERGQKHEHTQSDIHNVNGVGGWIDDGVDPPSRAARFGEAPSLSCDIVDAQHESKRRSTSVRSMIC